MKKHYIIIKWVTIGALFSIFSAFSKKVSEVDKHDYPWIIGEESKLLCNTEDGLTLTLKEGTLTPTGATFILRNAGIYVVYYGQQYFLQIQLDDEWFNIEKYTSWTLELIHINPGEVTELPVDWSNFYGELPPGNYRFVKEFRVSNYSTGKKIYLCCPFTINTNQ